MTDRIVRNLTWRGGWPVFGAMHALALLVTANTVVAAETPPAEESAVPAAASTTAAPNPAPALPPTARARAADDDDATKGTAPSPDSDASPAVPASDASPNALVTTRAAVPGAIPETPDVNRIDDGRMGTHQEHWLFGIGVRETFVTSKSYDPFSTDNVLPQVSLDLGRAFYASGPLSFASMLLWDYGTTKATARGAETSLAVHRLGVGLEARYHLLRRLYVFGRVAPGALHSGATLHDQVVGVDREANAWVFASDFSLGSAFEFAGDARGASTRPRGWIGLDGGYAWAQSSKLDFKAAGSDPLTPARLAALSFADLALGGAFFRLTATLTY